MKKALACLSGLACAAMLSTATLAEDNKTGLETEQQKIGYSFGQMFGRRLGDSMPELDINSFVMGIQDAYSGNPSKLTDEEIAALMQAYQTQQQAKQRQQMEELANTNLEKGTAFLTENAKKDGVVTTESGLQYKVLTKGDGKNPALTDTVEVHYTGTLINGDVFDSSVQRGKSVTFPVNGVIPGWIEALQLMKPGSKWQLFIPADLAYGPSGNGRIGPNETLLFEVELIAIK
ncbi:peptidylprolyl isomerase [Hahella sp. CCB-MM4]|uniref:FKBP-type peptidyl-prolyl cis-trans isomerase N-terminal domain-containing protein n=1 Tax=Hahella sp. (strain CCB-MM4) TaxID=1926491 RepID=UPI000B9AFFE5|nr:FKBP-type peptidyl-prolyl cis-trans isomerase [Hahella sp. CCB-MM4]OZG74646.1 peptidylprolyl isomerase [Hahella sp. CCB-MM4]